MRLYLAAIVSVDPFFLAVQEMDLLDLREVTLILNMLVADGLDAEKMGAAVREHRLPDPVMDFGREGMQWGLWMELRFWRRGDIKRWIKEHLGNEEKRQ